MLGSCRAQPFAVTFAVGVFLYVLSAPLSVLTMEQALSLLPSQIALAAALALFNDFKSLLLMSSLSPQNTAPPTASDSLPNPLITQGWS